MRSTRLAFVLVLGALAASGCSRTTAKASPDNPPLDMPAPPPREVEPIDTEAPAPVPLPQEPARTAPRTTPKTTPREPPRENRAEPPRTEPPKPEPAAPAPPVEPPKPEEPSRPPTTLQTIPPGAEPEVERSIQATLQRANTDLNRVDYRTLNADAKTQYDTAKNIIRQANEAIRAKNLLYAKNLADKAAALAAQLAGR